MVAGMRSSLAEIVRSLDDLLRTPEVPDYPNALNGLQLENNGKVAKVACAVDACLPVIDEAAAAGADLLVVHHGLFWGGLQAVTGSAYRKLRRAITAGLAVYSAHIPLDIHSEHGNNSILAKLLKLNDPEPFFPWKNILLGVRGETDVARASFVRRVARAVGGPVHLCPGGPDHVRRVGVVTGAAGGEIAGLAASGVDTVVTGEGPHWSYTAAEELGVNLVYAGHYATETFGVRSLAAWIEATYGLPWAFLDHPSGL